MSIFGHISGTNWHREMYNFSFWLSWGFILSIWTVFYAESYGFSKISQNISLPFLHTFKSLFHRVMSIKAHKFLHCKFGVRLHLKNQVVFRLVILTEHLLSGWPIQNVIQPSLVTWIFIGATIHLNQPNFIQRTIKKNKSLLLVLKSFDFCCFFW